MKKLYKGLIVLFLLLALVLGLSACKEEPAQQEHEHTFSEEWATDANYHWHAATCDHTDQVAGKAKHKWTSKVTKEATHTENGEVVYTCSVCKFTKTEAIPAKTQVHTYDNASWEYDDNYHWHPTTCGHDAKGSFEPHTWDTVEILTPATCDAEGTAQYTCKCGATKTEPIPCHTFSTEWTSDDTYHWHAATCEHDAVSEKTEHVWGSVVNKGNGNAEYTCSICGKKVTKALPVDIRMVTTGPGEDASKGVVISWHSTAKGSYLEYTDADGNEFVNTMANILCNEALSEADWYEGESAKHYRCKVYLNNLTPGSTYKYRIKASNGEYSDVATFKTAEANSTYFQFMWMSDLHAPATSASCINRVRELISFAQSKPGVDLDFVIFTGDMVEKGQRYTHWKYWSDSGLMNDITYAFVCGNHDYYGANDKVRTINDFYKEVCAYPANNTTAAGKNVLDSNYWFIWNRVLFVCIDNFTTESTALSSQAGAKLSDQQAWFKAVVTANEGKYDYLIFAQHLPWFDRDSNTPCEYGNYSSWRKIFDTYKVDFALSSDEHHYRRTYPLYNNAKTELVDGKVSTGTVYVTSNQTEGSSLDQLYNELSTELKYLEYSAGGQGGVYFTVTPTEMTLHQIGKDGKEYDTITVMKKDRSK